MTTSTAQIEELCIPTPRFLERLLGFAQLAVLHLEFELMNLQLV